MTWSLYRVNNDTGKTFVVEECDKRKLGVIVYNTLHDSLAQSRNAASATADSTVASLVDGRRVDHGNYTFSVVRDD